MNTPTAPDERGPVLPPEASAPATGSEPASAPAAETAAASVGLSPEEQMALFEKDLKENDWGHQPC